MFKVQITSPIVNIDLSKKIKINGSAGDFFTWKSVRCNKDTRMVAPFVCTALWDKILTCDNLMKKGITLVD